MTNLERKIKNPTFSHLFLSHNRRLKLIKVFLIHFQKGSIRCVYLLMFVIDYSENN